jgi:hypothetical protein
MHAHSAGHLSQSRFDSLFGRIERAGKAGLTLRELMGVCATTRDSFDPFGT